jgi:hypothetical protein
MPLLLFGIPTGILWFRDRRSIPAAINRWLERLRPSRRQRLTFWLAAAFAVIHLIVAVIGDIAFATLYDFFFPRRYGETRLVATVAEGVLLVLVWGTPLFGTLWAWLFVRLRNRLLTRRPSHYCVDCGYDLTGNVSGRCPECGREIRAGIKP